jgi:predicted O-methyltransferase YrrM
MEFNYVANIVDKVPYISKTNANYIYDFIIENKIQNILELGIAHGTATCYMAAALNKLGAGKITAVDLQSVAKDFKPSCEEQLKKCNLERYVEVHRMKTGYNWFLHNKIKENSINNKCEEEYDLCIIDGPKNWIIDSSAFFLVDKLLKKGGFIIFDDYAWTYENANNKRDSTDGINHNSLSDDELKLPHIKEIFDLLVKQHPNYSNFKVFSDKQWCMAQKISSEKKIEILEYDYFNSEDNIQLSKKISKLYNQIEKLKNNGNKFLIYGYGSMAKIIESLMPKQITGFIDLNYDKLNNEKVFSIENGLKKDFDFILISILGREEEVIDSLINEYSIQKDKIIKLI